MSADRVDAAMADAEHVAAALALQADIAWFQKHGQTPATPGQRLLAWLDDIAEDHEPAGERCPECLGPDVRRVGTDSGLDLYACRCGWSS